MMKKNILTAVLLLVSSIGLKAGETDTFTDRSEFLQDSSAIINGRANFYFRTAISTLNSKRKGCNETALYVELLKYFKDRKSSRLAKEIYFDSTIPRRVLKVNQTVYREWDLKDSIGLGTELGSKEMGTLSPVLHFGELTIGADKFEHLFEQGWTYFEKSHLKNMGEMTAIAVGMLKEKVLLGGNRFTNGVYSFADLSANLNGMRFWNHILQKKTDVLNINLGPYVVCKDEQWVVNKEINLKNYFDATHDEVNNCSDFMSDDALSKFNGEVQKLGMTCPYEPEKIMPLYSKYGVFSKWMMNTEGNAILDFMKEMNK